MLSRFHWSVSWIVTKWEFLRGLPFPTNLMSILLGQDCILPNCKAGIDKENESVLYCHKVGVSERPAFSHELFLSILPGQDCILPNCEAGIGKEGCSVKGFRAVQRHDHCAAVAHQACER